MLMGGFDCNSTVCGSETGLWFVFSVGNELKHELFLSFFLALLAALTGKSVLCCRHNQPVFFRPKSFL